MPPAETTQQWVWRNLQITLPADWEMLQFSREEAQGRCAFADARQFRLELSWAVVPKAPDLSRLMNDYRSKLEKNKTITEAQPAKIAGWHGLIGQRGDQPISRFGFYHEAGTLLTELVFLWPEERDKNLESTILHSCQLLAPRSGEPVRWCAFGMDLLAPPDQLMHTCLVQPALAHLAFHHPKNKPEQMRFQRLGMVKNWLEGTVQDWLQRQAPPELHTPKLQSLPHAGIERAVMSGIYQPKGAFRHKGNYFAAAWIEPTDQRLYFVESVTRAPALDLRHLLARLRPIQ